MSNMQNKSDVKAMMARFQGSGGSTEESSPSRLVGRPKQSVYPTLSSGPAVYPKKPVLESLSGSGVVIPPKPSFLKNTVSTKSDTEVTELNKTKALASRFSNSQDNTNGKPALAKKEPLALKPPLGQTPEAKDLREKPPISKPPLNSSFSDSKPAIPKPSLGVADHPKPSWVKEDCGGGDSSPLAPKTPLAAKPASGMLRLRQQNIEAAADSGSLRPTPAPAAAKPQPSHFKAAQNMFSKEPDKTEQSDGKAAAVSALAPKPPPGKKPSLKKPSPQAGGADAGDPSAPKRKPLPNTFSLGPAPAKPNRPPKVNLEPFKQGAESCNAAPGTLRKPVVPVPQAPQPGGQVTSSPALPSLPPRHPTTLAQQEDFYDDIDDFSNAPPPLPPAAGHPSHRGTKAQEEDEDDDGEMYEDLDERWDAAEQKQDKKDKKQQELEKKEQREKEKKEQEARKKFKLVGPLTAVQQVKAHIDCKGNKTDLTLKQGESLDIIRVQGNPEGKWLARSLDGSIGYVKTTSVEIDFDSLKAHKAQPAYEPEVYDDIDVPSTDKSSFKGPGVVLPPLPGEEGEIYDDVVDPNLEVSASDTRASPLRPLGFLRMFDRSRRAAGSKVVPPPSQFTAESNADQPSAAIDEEVYDDVDSASFPPLPPLSSLPNFKGKSKSEDAELKRQKKMEKEEKEFRKKFKFEGEIKVLYQATIIPTLTNKKWASKELPVKAGERLDVIEKSTDDKLICRNEEGKFGYVSTSNTVMADGDVYDDIDCIYDND